LIARTVALTVALCLAGTVRGEDTASSGSAATADMALLAEVRAIAERVEEVRGTRFSSSPVAVRGSGEAARRARDVRTASTIEEGRLAARGRAWADIGLGDDRRPARLLAIVAGDVVGISLDVDFRRLIVDPDRLTDDDFEPAKAGEENTTLLVSTGIRPDEPVVAHVLVHLLQLQRHDGDYLRDTTDGLLAAAALAEGEANLVAMLYLFQSMGVERTVVEFGLGPEEILEGALVPPDVVERPLGDDPFLDFVYHEGLAQLSDAFRRGGWAAVQDLLRRSATTRDVLHSERKPSRETPPDPPALPLPEGYALRDRDVLGEQSVIVLVSRLTGKDNLGLIAGDGWAGDALYRWEPDDDPAAGVTAWVTRWETEDAADDFDYAITRALTARYGKDPVVTPDGSRRFLGEGRDGFLSRAGREIVFWVGPSDLVARPAVPAPAQAGQ
jgi:hypothetical protein